MHTESQSIWPIRLDRLCAITGALVPVGIAVGNIAFESLIVLVVLCWIARCVIARENPLGELAGHPLVIPWLVWFLSIGIGCFYYGPGSKGWGHDVAFIRFLLFGLALFDISRRVPLPRYFLYGLAAAVCWAAVNTLSAYVLGHDLLGRPLIRYTGKLKEASRISGIAVYAAPFFVTWGVVEDRLSLRARATVLGVGLVAGLQLLQTQIRTAIIASAVGMLYGVALFIRRRLPIWAVVTCVSAVFLTLGLFFHFGRLWDLNTLYDRVYYWKIAWDMWKESPFFGVGVSSFQDAYTETALSGRIAPFVAPNKTVFQLAEVTHAHNILLMLAASTGVVGVFGFSWLLINAVRAIYRNLEGFRVGLAIWPVVLLVLGITGFNIYHSWYQALTAFFLVLAGCDAFGKLKEQDAQQ